MSSESMSPAQRAAKISQEADIKVEWHRTMPAPETSLTTERSSTLCESSVITSPSLELSLKAIEPTTQKATVFSTRLVELTSSAHVNMESSPNYKQLSTPKYPLNIESIGSFFEDHLTHEDSQDSEPKTASFRFLDLCGALRNIVYDFYMDDFNKKEESRTVSFNGHLENLALRLTEECKPVLPALTMTSKQMWYETRGLARGLEEVKLDNALILAQIKAFDSSKLERFLSKLARQKGIG